MRKMQKLEQLIPLCYPAVGQLAYLRNNRATPGRRVIPQWIKNLQCFNQLTAASSTSYAAVAGLQVWG